LKELFKDVANSNLQSIHNQHLRATLHGQYSREKFPHKTNCVMEIDDKAVLTARVLACGDR